MDITAINPATGLLLKKYQQLSEQETFAKIEKAKQAFITWKHIGFSEKAVLMHNAARVLREYAPQYAVLMTQEMGKPIRQSYEEIEKCAWGCDFYAENAADFLKPELVNTNASRSFVTCNPLGVVLAVMPWNFPFWQVFRFAAPALMAGNVGLLKHATNVPGCALAIEEVFRRAGFPDDVFTTLLIDSHSVASVIANPNVVAVTLTGSTRAGQSVASEAGKVLKKTVLELGGSDAYIVLADADLDLAAKTCVTSRLLNSGQSCISAKRFIVEQSIQKEFEQRCVQQMQAAIMGDPMNENTTVGPLARTDLREELHKQVSQSIEQGAHCLLGGKIPSGSGAFYPPTILTNVGPGMPAYTEELFGPVAAIISAKNQNHAIEIANDSVFGLGAAVFTQDLAKGEAIAAELLEAGSCFVNTLVRSDPRLPFGGVKQSGYGRELSHYGIKEFVNIKSVYIL
jgi:succinate-semialdehyde dehydrogenase/glutarate-semialdehyde dehydrogenase